MELMRDEEGRIDPVAGQLRGFGGISSRRLSTFPIQSVLSGNVRGF